MFYNYGHNKRNQSTAFYLFGFLEKVYVLLPSLVWKSRLTRVFMFSQPTLLMKPENCWELWCQWSLYNETINMANTTFEKKLMKTLLRLAIKHPPFLCIHIPKACVVTTSQFSSGVFSHEWESREFGNTSSEGVICTDQQSSLFCILLHKKCFKFEGHLPINTSQSFFAAVTCRSKAQVDSLSLNKNSQ